MNVLCLSPTSALGGAEKVLLGTMRAVQRTCPEIRFQLLALSSGPLVEQAAQLGVETSVLPIPATLASLGDSQLHAFPDRCAKVVSLTLQALRGSGELWNFMRCWRQKISRFRPDLIHSNGVKTHGLACLAAPTSVPVLWHVHDFLGARPLARRFLGLAARRVAGAIAVSEAVAADLRAFCASVPVRVIANTVNVKEFAPTPRHGDVLDELAGLAPSSGRCLRVGLVATYALWKGQKVFLNAVARVAKANPNLSVRFYIIGGPIYATLGSQFKLEDLRSLACQLGIDKLVGFIELQKDVSAIYHALDIVVHASTAPEPFGMTIIEAMACGKAVIATLGGGASEIFRAGHDAYGVPPGQVQALADAIVILARDADLRHRLGKNARATVCARFNQDTLGQQMVSCYKELMRTTKVPNASLQTSPTFMIPSENYVTSLLAD